MQDCSVLSRWLLLRSAGLFSSVMMVVVEDAGLFSSVIIMLTFT